MLWWQSIAFVFDTFSLSREETQGKTNLGRNLQKKKELARSGQLGWEDE